MRMHVSDTKFIYHYLYIKEEKEVLSIISIIKPLSKVEVCFICLDMNLGTTQTFFSTKFLFPMNS